MATLSKVHGTRNGTLRIAGLFAGIGGFELGLGKQGHTPVAFSEIDPAACAVLRARFPTTQNLGDLRQVNRLPANIDLLTAGFPCQDLSQAGTTKGIHGAKSSLVQHVFRLLQERRVPWVLIENVPFMLSLDRGRAIDLVTQQLSELGYRWAYRVVDARSFGLPQRRRRVFLLASLTGNPADVLLCGEAAVPAARASKRRRAIGFYWTEGNTGVGWTVEALPTLKGGSGLGIPSPPAVIWPDGRVVKPDIRDGERLQGFPEGWTEPAGKLGSRWKAVGNAVCVPIAEWLGQCLRAPGKFDTECVAGSVRPGQWPTAAFDLGDGPTAVALSEWPLDRPTQPLSEFLHHPGEPLSLRATAGFVRRAERAQRLGKLQFEPWFLTSLHEHLLRMRPKSKVHA
jgi:DNA (cytosine-5)-methyltransferase 1